MDWVSSFFAGFDGPAWTTFGVSVAALAVSVVALIRGRTPQPRWEYVGIAEGEVGDPRWLDVRTGIFHNTMPQWSARVRQHGPGDTEAIFTSKRSPDGMWTEEERFYLPVVGRGGEILIHLGAQEKIPGEYAVRIRYRAMPNTRKERVWEKTVVLE